MTDNPFGLHTVTPYLVVPNVRRLIAFQQALFGAKLRGVPHYQDDGSIAHAELEIGDSVIMMGEPHDEWTAMPANLYIYVEDCDAAFEKAQALGATALQAPKQYDHGDRLAGIKDPTGVQWWLASHAGKTG